jgi:hypothetical protein
MKGHTMNVSTHPFSKSRHPLIWLAVIVIAWLLLVVWAAQGGALASLAKIHMPAYAMLVALGIVLPVVAYFNSSFIRSMIDAVGLHRLTLMHIWRIPAALVFFYYGMQNALPPLFWILAGVGDFLAGCLAMTMFWRTRSEANYRQFHLFGFADFVSAVGTGLTFTLLEDPRMVLLTTLPMALIPLFGVGLSGASHIIAFNHLRNRRNV